VNQEIQDFIDSINEIHFDQKKSFKENENKKTKRKHEKNQIRFS